MFTVLIALRFHLVLACMAGHAALLLAEEPGPAEAVVEEAPVRAPFLQPEALPIIPLPHEPSTPTLTPVVQDGDEVLLVRLLQAGVTPDQAPPGGDTPLCAALRSGRADLAILLLLHGADPNLRGLENQPPVALASLRRHPLLLKVMLAAGADPNLPFASPHSKQLVALVPDSHLRSEMKHQRNVTPLMACAARGDVEATALLLQWGADKHRHTLPHYRYAINFAADQRYLFVMRLLLGRDPEREPEVLITVDLSRQKATLAVQGVTRLETSISTGRHGYATPAGRYVITNKYKNWISTLYDVPMPWFMRLNCGAIGLHSGHVTGRPASHGCIRLPPEMARKFFQMAQIGDEVNIVP